MGRVIAFVPASGGVGSSTLGCAVAVRAVAAGRSGCVVDLDAVSGRLDVVCGIEQEPGWRWDRLAQAAGVVDGAALVRELPSACGVPVLTGALPRPVDQRAGLRRPGAALVPDVVGDVVGDVVAGLRAAHDVTVLDLARDEGVVAAVAGLVDAWVLVSGVHVPQLGATARSLPWLRAVVRGAAGEEGVAQLAVTDGPWVVLRGSRVDDDVADAVTDHLDVAVVGTCAHDARLAADVTGGLAPGARGRGPVVELADELLLRLLSLPEPSAPRVDDLAGAAADLAERWAS